MTAKSSLSDVVVIGAISKLTQVPGGLLVEVAATRPSERAVTLVHRLSGDAQADQMPLAAYERMRDAGTEVRFQCSRSAPFNAPRIEKAGPNDDLASPGDERPTRSRVARSLEHATEVLGRVDRSAATAPDRRTEA